MTTTLAEHDATILAAYCPTCFAEPGMRCAVTQPGRLPNGKLDYSRVGTLYEGHFHKRRELAAFPDAKGRKRW